MREWVIGKNDANQRLDKFLHKAAPRLPQSLMYKYLRLKRIKVNGKKGEIRYRLAEGDRITLYVNDEFFEEADPVLSFLQAPARLSIVYEDENILLLDKKPGQCVHEDNENSVDTLIHRVQHYLYDKGEYCPEQEHSFAPALANRIDRNTSGIVMVAKNAQALRILNQVIREREVHKYYLCVAVGHLHPEHAKLTAYLKREEGVSRVEVFSHPIPEGRTIVTEYRVLEYSAQNSLLEVELHTGRTHQIRAHLAHIGHPLLGDGKYGDNRVNRRYGVKTQLLCSYKLRFDFSSEEHLLGYLNHREFQVESVWFRDCFSQQF